MSNVLAEMLPLSNKDAFFDALSHFFFADGHQYLEVPQKVAYLGPRVGELKHLHFKKVG